MLIIARKKLWLFWINTACMAAGVLFAQTPPNLPSGSTFVRVSTFTDYLIPNNIQSLYIRARGGNGGSATHGLCNYQFPANMPAVVNNLNGKILGGYPAGGGTRNAAAHPVIIRGNVQVLKNVTIDGVSVRNP